MVLNLYFAIWAQAYPNDTFSFKSKMSKNRLLIFFGSIYSFSEPFCVSFPMLTQEISLQKSISVFAFTLFLDKFWVHSIAFPHFFFQGYNCHIKNWCFISEEKFHIRGADQWQWERKTMYWPSSYSLSLLTNGHKYMIIFYFPLFSKIHYEV